MSRDARDAEEGRQLDRGPALAAEAEYLPEPGLRQAAGDVVDAEMIDDDADAGASVA